MQGDRKGRGADGRPGEGPARGHSSEQGGADEPAPRRRCERAAGGRRHGWRLDRSLGAWGLHPQILGALQAQVGVLRQGEAGPRMQRGWHRGAGRERRGAASGGREWKRGHSRHPGVHGLGRTEVPCVHCTFPRVPFESGAARNVTTKHRPPPSHSRHQSWWVQGGDGRETPGQHRPGHSEQRGARPGGRGHGLSSPLLLEREARPAGLSPFVVSHKTSSSAKESPMQRECKARRHLRRTRSAQRLPLRHLRRQRCRQTHAPPLGWARGWGPRPGASPHRELSPGKPGGPPRQPQPQLWGQSHSPHSFRRWRVRQTCPQLFLYQKLAEMPRVPNRSCWCF